MKRILQFRSNKHDKNIYLKRKNEVYHEEKMYSQGHQMPTVFCKISVRRSKNCLEFFIDAGAPNENIVQNHLNIALLNVF